MKRRAFDRTKVILGVAAMFALVGCAGGATVTRDNISSLYLPEELYVVATGDNELRTVIIGNPFDMPKEAFDAAVLARMEGKNFGPRLNLSTDPEQEDPRKRHVAIAFDLASVLTARALCTADPQATETRKTGDRVTVTGIYCAGDQYLTQATARADGVSGPDSPQFRSMMTQLAIALFPQENPHRRPDESLPLPP